MSSLPGHGRITRQAMEDLHQEPRYAEAFSAQAATNVAGNVMARDVLDVVILGHWSDFGQCHHFMRRFDGQSEREAYAEAVEWIRRNALEATRLLARRAVLNGGVISGSQTPISQSLGNALHALQDSFASGHAIREETQGSEPGPICKIKRYAGDEKHGHEEADEEWHVPGHESVFSAKGWMAIEATKALLRIIVDSTATARGGRTPSLLGFELFRTRWLRVSPALSDQRDRAFDLIDRYTLGIRIGATNLKTINMDEDALAAALVREAGADTKLVLEVFTKLDEQYNSDADDVAEIYVNEIRRRKGPLEAALKSDRALVARLIKVMDEGWTSAGEADCIRYLKSLE
ncbi:MAG TPA: hypothetical protein VMH61_05470 [Candidatus Acidoferrales bacterium]|nr:hypothetical protein [Candidatus Acidoferrales bacterium]